MAFSHMSMGLGPDVYLLMRRGSPIWIGTMGIPSSASFSRGTPSSISFRPVTASAAANPIYIRQSRATRETVSTTADSNNAKRGERNPDAPAHTMVSFTMTPNFVKTPHTRTTKAF